MTVTVRPRGVDVVELAHPGPGGSAARARLEPRRVSEWRSRPGQQLLLSRRCPDALAGEPVADSPHAHQLVLDTGSPQLRAQTSDV